MELPFFPGGNTAHAISLIQILKIRRIPMIILSFSDGQFSPHKNRHKTYHDLDVQAYHFFGCKIETTLISIKMLKLDVN